MTSEFDPLHYAQRLEAAGVPERQAAVHAQAMAEVAAYMAPAKQLTQVEARLQQEMFDMEQRLNLRIDIVRSELLAKIELVRLTLDAKIDTVRHDIETSRIFLEGEIGQLKVELRMLKWVLGMQLGFTAAILFKLFLP